MGTKEETLSTYEAYVYWLILNDIATKKEIDLVTGILGHSEDVLGSILYYRTACRSREEWEEKHHAN